MTKKLNGLSFFNSFPHVGAESGLLEPTCVGKESFDKNKNKNNLKDRAAKGHKDPCCRISFTFPKLLLQLAVAPG